MLASGRFNNDARRQGTNCPHSTNFGHTEAAALAQLGRVRGRTR